MTDLCPATPIWVQAERLAKIAAGSECNGYTANFFDGPVIHPPGGCRGLAWAGVREISADCRTGASLQAILPRL